MSIATGKFPGFLLFVVVSAAACCALRADDEVKPVVKKPASEKAAVKKTVVDKDGWSPLFNGKDLDGWAATEFGGEGEVSFEKGYAVIGQGVALTAITSKRKDLPKTNYEIEFEALRFDGSDFFIGLTFPVMESHCSLICGGWGGGVTGLSSVDGMDAVENETTGYVSFTNGQWYKVRLKVTPEKLEAWLDGKSLVDLTNTGQKIDVRFEMDLCKPLGFASYQSTAHIRNARIRALPAKAKGKANAAPATTGTEKSEK